MDWEKIFFTFLGFILGILGAAIGSYFSHKFSECRERRKEFNKAAAEFRAAFIEEHLLLGGNLLDRADELRAILKESTPRHERERAVVVFREYLETLERESFDQAWRQYSSDPDEYFSGGSSVKKERTAQLARERIEKLLSFAKRR